MGRYGFGALIGFVMLVMAPGAVQADLNTSLQNMFNGWGTAAATRPGAYQSQTEGALAGGSLSARVPNETFRLLSVAPPQFKMGCGGIDLYLGSISFPSLSRFTDLLQQLGTAGVAGFAFQLAMLELCQSCENVIAKLEAAARAINNAGRLQPCQMGQEMAKAVHGDPNKLGDITNNIGAAWQGVKEAGGAVTDIWADRDTVRTQTTADGAAALAGTPDDIRGNLVYRVLVDAGWTTDDARAMMSVTGTVVVGDQGIPSYMPPVLTFADLVEVRAGVDTVRMYDCGADVTNCLTPDDTPGTATFDGFRTRAEAVYDSIVQKIQVLKVPLSAEEVALVDRSSIPLYRILVDHAKTASLANTVKSDISEALAIELGYVWIDWVNGEVQKQASSMQKKYPNFPASMSEFYTRLADQLKDAQMLYNLKLKQISVSTDYAVKIQQIMKKSAPVAKKKKASSN